MLVRFRRPAAALRCRFVPFLALALLPAASAAQHFPADEDLDVMLRYLVEDGETPGIVLGLLEADGSTRIVWHGSAGPDARELGPKSVFELGSITKVFTGTLLADMVARGEVALSDPVAKYLPAGVTVPSRNGREITLLDLATHRSSLTRMANNMAVTGDNPYPDYPIEQLYAFLSDHELRRDIGAEYEYSNIGVALLGEALARAAGMSYEELVRTRILEPLGMQMTGTVVTGELSEWNTQGHRDGEVAPYRGWTALPAMGALRSNAEDMLVFLAANIGEPESPIERAMRSTHEPRASVNPQTDIGLNWQIRKLGERRIITHGGGTAGYNTLIAFDPDLGVGVVQLTNTGEFGDDIGLDILRRGAPLAIPEVTVADEVLARYAGAYEVAPGRAMVVRLEDEGNLTFQAPGNVRFRMYAESDTKFFIKRTPWRITFTKDDAGNVVGLVADLEGTERTARKVSDAGPPPAVVAGNAAQDLALTVAEMAPYEGTYEMRAGEQTLDLRVFVEDGQLMGQPAGQSSSRLLYQGNHQFRPEADTDILLVFTLVDGLAQSLTLTDGGTTYPGTRKPTP